MKTTASVLLRTWTAAVAGLAAAAGFTALADSTPAAATAKREHHYTGTIVSVDPQEHVLKVRGSFLSTKSFNLGDACSYALAGQQSGALSDLHAGQRVKVAYLKVGGVLVADGVEERPLRREGMVEKVDPDKHTMTLHHGLQNTTYRIADNCRIVLRDDKSGTLDDVRPGDHVTVTYETPGDGLLAREIDQTRERFTGNLTALDLDARTIKAKSAFATKRFSVADDCAIVLNGKLGGHLRDLKPDEKLTFSYQVVNGVNIANRIANAEEPSMALTAQTAQTAQSK